MKEFTAEEVSSLYREKKIILIDVREDDEYAAERIQGAYHIPLSTFSVDQLPKVEATKLVFHCAGGVRSAKVVKLCDERGLSGTAHMLGGLKAWKAAGLKTDIA